MLRGESYEAAAAECGSITGEVWGKIFKNLVRNVANEALK